MKSEDDDRALLAATLAGQLGFLDPARAPAPLTAEPPDSRVLDRLLEDGALTLAQRKVVDAMVDGVVRAHAGQVPEVLRSLTSRATLPLSGTPVVAAGRRPPPVPGAGEGEVTKERTGRYQLGTELGRGGQARVLLALDRHIGRDVAWKELLPDGGSVGERVSSGSAARFLREARITARLEHPNIVPVHELGERDDGTLYYTMRVVRGTTLDAKLQSCKSLADRMQLLGTYWDVCKAVAYAHGHGVTHRDLKPANIMVGEFGETVVLDWGLAKVRGTEDLRGSEIAERARSLQTSTTSDTVEGCAVGTPSYMSPEQALGLLDEIDERSDVWGLGAVLYEILTGRPPFQGVLAQDVLRQVIEESPRPVSLLSREAPAELQAVAHKALKRNRAERYRTAWELAEDISAYVSGRRVQAYEYSSWQLFRRFAQRHKAALAAVATVLVVILGALGTVAVAYRRESLARSREQQERLHANHHLAHAYTKQAEILADEGDLLGARVYAAAALLNNPSYPASPVFSPDFAGQEPDNAWTLAGATSLVARSEFAFVRNRAHSLALQAGSYALSWAPSGRLVAAGDFDGLVYLWEPIQGKLVHRFQAHKDRVFGLAFAPDSKHLASGGRDLAFKVWEVGRAEPLLTVPTADFTLSALAYSPDGKRIAVGGDRGQLLIVDATTGQTILRVESHSDRVRDLAYSADGKRLASASWDKTARLWQADSLALQRTLSGHTGAVYGVAFSPDGSRLATASYDKTARVWDVETGQQKLTLEGSRDALYHVAYSPDGLRLVTSGMERAVRLWDALSGKRLATLVGHADSTPTASFSPDGTLLATASHDRQVRLWTYASQDGLKRFNHGDWVSRVVISPDGNLLVTTGADRAAIVWDLKTGKRLVALQGHRDTVEAVAFNPKGTLLATGGADRAIRLWDLKSGLLLRDLEGSEGPPLHLAFSPDGVLLASCGREKALRLWDVQTGALVAKLEEHSDWALEVAFAPEGRLLASASADHSVRLWDLGTRQLVGKLEGHGDWVSSVQFSPEGKHLFSSGKDKLILQWDVAQRKVVRRLEGHDQWVNHVTLSRDGKLLSSASDDGLAVVWDTKSGRPLQQVRAGGAVNTAVLSPEGRYLAVASNDEVTLYPVSDRVLSRNPQQLLGEAEAAAGVRLHNFALLLER